jgi:putative methionine-R-sulfoxide reductase with GAF domain
MDSTLQRLESLLSGGSRIAQAGAAAELIRQAGAFRWVGLYDVTPTEIRAIAWTGTQAPASTFPRSQGLNGAAVATQTTVLVPDVAQDPRYLTAFASTGSEMIVPVLVGDPPEVRGTIDVESERVNAFGPRDQHFVESWAEVLRPLWA